MIISHRHKFIWFQPWKIASNTIFTRIGHLNQSIYPQESYFNKILGKLSSKHIDLCDFKKLPEFKLDYRTVCFVRNPYDRFYSGFLQCRKDYITEFGNDFSLKPWGTLLEKGFKNYCNFAEDKFVKSEYFFPNISNFDNVYLNKKKYVNFVGFIERFENDFTEICKKLAIEAQNQNSLHIEKAQNPCDPHMINQNEYKYLNHYDKEMVETVNLIFKLDFKHFGFQKITEF